MAQQIHLLETIRAMKLATKRRHSQLDDSDGNKERFLHRDRQSYRRKVEHAGYTRTVLSTNPPLYDDDGDLYSPADSDHERNAEPLDEDPFGEVQLERLLRPLTSPSQLPTHPSLSVPYKSKALAQMGDEALEMLRRERASLWKAKRLLQRFRGDSDWVPCATFETDNDHFLLNGEESMEEQSLVPSLNADYPLLDLESPTHQLLQESKLAETAEEEPSKKMPGAERDIPPTEDAMEGIVTQDMAPLPAEESVLLERKEDNKEKSPEVVMPTTNGEEAGEAALPNAGTDINHQDDETGQNPAVLDIAEREAASETASNSNGTSTHAMTTRARARSPAERSDRTPSPSPSDSASVPAVNPWFRVPQSCLSDRDLGLPANEAEETRKLLLLYVQKQEQIVRSLDTLHAGLQKADRLRQYVFRACKAQAHLVPDGKGNLVTEMSDGEDWYDPSDWDLQPWDLKDGHLEKGKDEVEDVEEEGRRRRGRRVNRM